MQGILHVLGHPCRKIEFLVLDHCCCLIDWIGIDAVSCCIDNHAADLDIRTQFVADFTALLLATNWLCHAWKIFWYSPAPLLLLILDLKLESERPNWFHWKSSNIWLYCCISLILSEQIVHRSRSVFDFPATVFFCQMKRHFVMRNRDHRFNIIF